MNHDSVYYKFTLNTLEHQLERLNAVLKVNTTLFINK